MARSAAQTLRRCPSPKIRCQAEVPGVFVRSDAKELKRELRSLVEQTEQGVRTTTAQKTAILRCVAELEALGKEQRTTSEGTSATWKMLWTTEKETLFVLKNCSFFGKTPKDVFQVIDATPRRLQNVITFEPDSLFAVDAVIDIVSPQRINFQFQRAFYRDGEKPPFSLPPFGKGWFENVYLDDEIRIARDIRKDTLVTVRYGPPQTFT